MDRPPGTGSRAGIGAILLGAVLLWACVAARYEALSAVPLHPLPLLLRVGLLTLGHYLLGSSVAWILARRERPGSEAWAWYILLGSGTLPAVLWIADRLGLRGAGWAALALLVLGGLVLLWKSAPRAPGLLDGALVPLTLILFLAGAAWVGMDQIVYAKPGPQGVVLTAPEDNLVHAALALEWTRQTPYRHLLQAFAPEHVGIAYHYLTDVQIGAWWTLCGGDHLDFVQRERFLLQGFTLLIGLYLLARAVLDSRSWALVTVALLAFLPYWFLDIDGLPQRESLQRLWTSFTFENGAAFGAGFLACTWIWLQRGQAGWARIALVLAGFLFLAKVYFAVLAWAAAGCLVLRARPRAWASWIGGLALVGAFLVALQPRGPDIVPIQPEWAPGRFWSQLLARAASAAQDDRGLGAFVEWTGVGLGVLCLGALLAGLALRRWRPAGESGRGLVVIAAASWGAFFAYTSLFWFLDAHQTAFQFLPWLSLVSVLAGIAGLRAALARWLAGRRRLRIGATLAGIALWGLVLAGAWHETDGFSKSRWNSFSLTDSCWRTLGYLRAETPRSSRVLAPFEPSAPGPRPSPYAIAGVAGRRAVNEHSGLAVWLPGVSARMDERKARVAEFYRDPRPDRLAALAAEWGLDYAVLPTAQARQLPAESGSTVFETPQWSVVRLGQR